jgi:heterotetrameric sarcosine oxidase gamma subunit
MTSPRYPVTIARAPLTARFELVGAASALIAVLTAAGLPVPASPSSVLTGAGGGRTAWCGPRRMIVTAALDERARLGSALRAAVPLDTALVVADVTGATTSFVLKGSGIDAVLAQGFAHDLSSLAFGPGRILATDGWGTAAILEHLDDDVAITVDASFADYVEHMLRTAAGLPTASMPGVMRAPPPPIRST